MSRSILLKFFTKIKPITSKQMMNNYFQKFIKSLTDADELSIQKIYIKNTKLFKAGMNISNEPPNLSKILNEFNKIFKSNKYNFVIN